VLFLLYQELESAAASSRYDDSVLTIETLDENVHENREEHSGGLVKGLWLAASGARKFRRVGLRRIVGRASCSHSRFSRTALVVGVGINMIIISRVWHSCTQQTAQVNVYVELECPFPTSECDC